MCDYELIAEHEWFGGEITNHGHSLIKKPNNRNVSLKNPNTQISRAIL